MVHEAGDDEQRISLREAQARVVTLVRQTLLGGSPSDAVDIALGAPHWLDKGSKFALFTRDNWLGLVCAASSARACADMCGELCGRPEDAVPYKLLELVLLLRDVHRANAASAELDKPRTLVCERVLCHIVPRQALWLVVACLGASRPFESDDLALCAHYLTNDPRVDKRCDVLTLVEQLALDSSGDTSALVRVVEAFRELGIRDGEWVRAADDVACSVFANDAVRLDYPPLAFACRRFAVTQASFFDSNWSMGPRMLALTACTGPETLWLALSRWTQECADPSRPKPNLGDWHGFQELTQPQAEDFFMKCVFAAMQRAQKDRACVFVFIACCMLEQLGLMTRPVTSRSARDVMIMLAWLGFPSALLLVARRRADALEGLEVHDLARELVVFATSRVCLRRPMSPSLWRAFLRNATAVAEVIQALNLAQPVDALAATLALQALRVSARLLSATEGSLAQEWGTADNARMRARILVSVRGWVRHTIDPEPSRLNVDPQWAFVVRRAADKVLSMPAGSVLFGAGATIFSGPDRSHEFAAELLGGELAVRTFLSEIRRLRCDSSVDFAWIREMIRRRSQCFLGGN